MEKIGVCLHDPPIPGLKLKRKITQILLVGIPFYMGIMHWQLPILAQKFPKVSHFMVSGGAALHLK